jgi:hypothetical protein
MVGTLDLRGVRATTVDDVAGLWAYLQQVVGQPFLLLRASYGEELTLHLGAPLPPSSPKLKRPRGSYVLTFRGSAWALRSGTGSLTLADPFMMLKPGIWLPVTLEDLEKSPPINPGAVVVSATPYLDRLSGAFGLQLAFSDGAFVQLRPTPEEGGPADDQELPPVADWELFTPYGRYLRVGPGPKWAYEKSAGGTDRPADGTATQSVADA